MTMKTKYGNYTRISVHNVRHSEVDYDEYAYLSSLVSELKNMKSYHEVRNGSPDMISYSIGKAIEYAERTMAEIEMRSTGELK